MTKLVTPGHGRIFDTYLMYGLIESIMRTYQDMDGYVQNFGLQYFIETKDELDDKMLTNAIREEIEEVVSDLETIKERNPEYLVYKPSDIDSIKKSLKMLIKAKDKLYKPVNSYNIETSHRIQFKEGRGSKEKESKTIYLLYEPTLGKFATRFHRYDGIQYTTCPLCLILASIGFHKNAGITVAGSRRRGKSHYVSVIHPLGRGTFEDILILKEFKTSPDKIESLSRRSKTGQISSKLALFLNMIYGETIAAFSSSFNWSATVYNVSIEEGRRIAIREINEIPARKLYTFIANSKLKGGRIINLVETVGKNDWQPLMELVESLLYSDKKRLYNALSHIYKILDENHKQLLSSAITKAATAAIY